MRSGVEVCPCSSAVARPSCRLCSEVRSYWGTCSDCDGAWTPLRCRCLDLKYRYAGALTNPTDTNHARVAPSVNPYAGISHAASNANELTLNVPSAIGPAAPAGTCDPCASHVATMTVVKMIGNTLTTPLTSGNPDRLMNNATPTTIVAPTPRNTNVSMLTRCVPRTAACTRRVAASASVSPTHIARIPQSTVRSTLGSIASCATVSAVATMIHAVSASTIVLTSSRLMPNA